MVDNPPDDADKAVRRAPRGRVPRWCWIVSFIIAAAILGVWLMRNRLAGDVIDDQLAALDLPATYDIESIEPGRQVLTNLVIGDPKQPDLTIERVIVTLDYGMGLPEIGHVTLLKPRLYGRYDQDGLSFGSLDRVLFGPDRESEGLPDFDVQIYDGRALVETLYGPVGAKVQGGGNLAGGFAAMLAVNAPVLKVDDCELTAATAYGELKTSGDGLGFAGPVRLRGANCPTMRARLANATMQVEASIPTDFQSANVSASLETDQLAYDDNALASLAGPLRVNWREGELDATADLDAKQVSVGGLPLRRAALDGALRMRDGYSRIEADGALSGSGVDLHSYVAAPLREAGEMAEGSLLTPLLARIRGASAQQLRATSFVADFTAGSTDKSFSLVIPALQLRGAGGASVLTASRLQYSTGLSGLPRLSGNIRSGGAGLPEIAGRMERDDSGKTVFRLRMQPYAAGANRLAIPEMNLFQAANGALSFDGLVEAGGALPGGSVRDMTIPVQGRWSSGGGFALWDSCTTVAFDRLEYANLVLSDRDLRVCPPRGKSIVSQNAGGVSIAAGVPELDLSGMLAGTPIRLSSGPVGFAYPGVAVARDIDVTLGPTGSASRFKLSGVEARFDTDGSVSGSFEDTRIELAAIPLDLAETSGQWTYRAGVLAISDGSFRLLDRQQPARFSPLTTRGATLQLADNVITANAELRHPGSDRIVTATQIRHNLSSATGGARLTVDGLRFDDTLQPDQLTDLALGVVANVEGVVTGTGQIDWNANEVTSSGQFSSDGLDLAAVFGPVRGARGTIEFSDLLSLTTAPNQSLAVDSINPGIEVNEGTIGFSLRDGQFLGVTGGSWPFMGGTLSLRPVDLNLGASEVRRYVLEVEGLDSAIFVQMLELGNIAATGIFDGSLPLVFDELGNGRIEGGILTSRPPGGNLSYIGELTYEDLSPMADYAFEMLRSLDYKQMDIEIDGPLTGDILSKIRLDGVKQGAEADRNFFTRQLEDVPIQFNININAPFYKLIGTLRAMYDPAFVKDPRELGLLSDDGVRLRETATQEDVEKREQEEEAETVPEILGLPPEEPAIQRRESEIM